ncbi:hypothetical protein CR51_35905 [Caballeronia megalochromosomata]|nr:hypothetical protein CR51_35905 [Caballeronia megalochromosomata]
MGALSPLEKMRQALSSKHGPQPVVLVQPLTEMNRHERELEKEIREKRPLPPPKDLVIEAIELFRETRRLANSRQARLVTLGCVEPLGKTHYRLIEDAERFPHVLTGVEAFRKHRQTFRNCYQGLLNAYLTYHPDKKGCRPPGRANWELLRQWLRRNIANIREQNGGVNEDWVTEVAAHTDVFSEAPVARFGKETLRGNREPFLLFKKTLGIKDFSWIVDQLVLEQVHAAGRSGTSEFLHYLPGLILLLGSVSENNKTLLNKAFAQILTYYHARTSGAPHKDLQENSVKRWGNPWLKRNNEGWDLVDRPVREMVTSWLKRHYIQYFFEVLAQEGKSDRRRLDFWIKYHEAVGPLTFALGPQTLGSNDEDMADARDLMEGMYVGLQGNGSNNNNAFIMQFGEWVVVEFAQKGNACFFFKESNLPFELNRDVSVPAVKNHIEGDSDDPRDPVRRTHRDLIEADWETTFERVLSARGIFAGQAALSSPAKRRSTTSRGPSGATPQALTRTAQPSQTAAAHARQSENASFQSPGVSRLTPKQEQGVKALCTRLGIRLEDLRSKNGNLWVYHDMAHDSRATPQLKHWGFEYRRGKGWWYKGPA